MPTSLENLRLVATRLGPLDIPFAFIGGAVLGLLVDDPTLTRIRSTKDVDVVVAIVNYGQQAALEERLRQAGFRHDTSNGAPICRWIVDGCLVDIMPQDSTALGLSARWFEEVLQEAQEVGLGEGINAKVITPALFIATKLEAFIDRGAGDFLGSRDMEDIVTVVNGRASIVNDVSTAPASVRSFIRERFAALLANGYFQEALPEHVYYLENSRDRSSLVRRRFEEISK